MKRYIISEENRHKGSITLSFDINSPKPKPDGPKGDVAALLTYEIACAIHTRLIHQQIDWKDTVLSLTVNGNPILQCEKSKASKSCDLTAEERQCKYVTTFRSDLNENPIPEGLTVPDPMRRILSYLNPKELKEVCEWLLSAEVVTEEMLKYYGLYDNKNP